jgi:hypothetical protein
VVRGEGVPVKRIVAPAAWIAVVGLALAGGWLLFEFGFWALTAAVFAFGG